MLLHLPVIISAVISQNPLLGVPTPLTPSVIITAIIGVFGWIKLSLGLAPAYLPAVASFGEVGMLVVKSAKEGMLSLAQNESDYPNQVRRLWPLPYSSYAF